MTRCSTATAASKKSHVGLLFFVPLESQLQPDELACPSSSPASIASLASGIFGTQVCALTLQVSFVLHCASVLHATHLPLGTSHT
jgi:hypothetical protein